MSADDETTRLRRRVKNQRAELRRLNRNVHFFSRGFHYSIQIHEELRFRKIMIDAFGLDAVMAAEKGS